MKKWQLTHRIDTLSEKLADSNPAEIIHIDVESFSEAEKQLFAKVDEIRDEYLQTGKTENLAKSYELILKEFEVFFRRVTELYCKTVPICLGCTGDREIVEYFFKLHFLNFEADLAECLTHVRTWSDEDREFFLADLKKNGAIFFRVPKGFTENDEKNLVDPKKSEQLALEEEEKDEEKNE